MNTTETIRYARRAARMKPSAVREILKTTESPEVISFAGGLPAPDLFPVAAIAEACRQTLVGETAAAALQYGVTEGFLPLRQWVCQHLMMTVGLECTPDQVLITSGSQQALDLVGRVLLDPGDIVLTEDPAYLGALQAFIACEAEIVGISSDEQGMCPQALREFLFESPVHPKLLYLNPTFQNPTGLTMPPQRRQELADVAAEFSIPILEDDPYGLLRYSGISQPALASLPQDNLVMYLGSSSKILAPGLRVAWLVVPSKSMLNKLVPMKQAADLHTSSLTQRIVHRYVAQPNQLQRHVAHLTRAYRHRRDAMLEALKQNFPEGCTWTRPDGGLFLWVYLPEHLDSLELLRSATERQVAFVPGESFWVSKKVRNTLRLNFSNASVERIHEGIRRLGEVIKQSLVTTSTPVEIAR